MQNIKKEKLSTTTIYIHTTKSAYHFSIHTS